MNIILIDCDGVLFDWESSFHRFMLRYGYVGEQYDETKYNMSERYGLHRDFSDRLVKHFNESAFMSSLSPLRDSVKYIRKLHDEHGYTFHCITSQSNLYQAQQLRIQNLEKTFGKDVFDGFTILNTGDDKDKALESWKDSGLFWIEDKLENALVGKNLGLNPILVRHNYTDIIEVAEAEIPCYWRWSLIYNYITGE